jgi:LmbE family N-acetylglucosaminyl deacetylase
MKDLFVVAHPDDAEVMLGHAIAASRDPLVVIATDGKSSTVDMLGNGFVRAGKRRLESQSGLRYLGVPLQRQVYAGLPDSQLGRHANALGVVLGEVSADFQPDRWFTTGVNGYDGHPDHIAAHEVTLQARKELGRQSVLWALESDHSGELVVAGRAYKLGAMAMHESQTMNPDLMQWGNTDVYRPLIVGAETYTSLGVETAM